MEVTTWEWVVLVAAFGIFGLAALAIVARVRRRRARLAESFGPEYYRTASESGSRAAERRLGEVEREHQELEIRELTPVARERYLDEWHEAERRFVSDPADAVRSAERIVLRLLEDRGYPSEDDAADTAPHVALDHPYAYERYRHARSAVLESNGSDETERLRRAILDYRAAFEDLVGGHRTAA
ncbi:MAG: hypothetical protein R6W48_09235 [Gaiellaceae bacterium]